MTLSCCLIIHSTGIWDLQPTWKCDASKIQTAHRAKRRLQSASSLMMHLAAFSCHCGLFVFWPRWSRVFCTVYRYLILNREIYTFSAPTKCVFLVWFAVPCRFGMRSNKAPWRSTGKVVRCDSRAPLLGLSMQWRWLLPPRYSAFM